MATFPSITPTYGIQKSSAPNVRTVRFGDGFEKRLSFGLNQNPKVYNLTFEVSETDADTIETFLDARADDNAAFDFTPPGNSSLGR
jgi:phage-related protein